MFRFEVGARILVKRFPDTDSEPIEVEILAKAPHMIKALILSDVWFARDSIHWLSAYDWFSLGRVEED